MSMGYEPIPEESLEELCRRAQRMADPIISAPCP